MAAQMESEPVQRVKKITIVTQELKAEAIRLYKEGLFLKDISARLNISSRLISRSIKEENLVPFNNLRSQPFHRHEKEAEIINHYKKYQSFMKLSRDLRVTAKTAKKILIDAGVEIREYLMTPEKEQEAVELYKQGMMIKDIASSLKFSGETISKLLAKHKVKAVNNFSLRNSENRPAYFTSPNVDEEIIKMYKSGISTTYIGSMFNTHRSTIVKLLGKYNIKKDNCYRKIQPAFEPEVINLYKKGLSASAIGKNYGVSKKVIFKVLKRNNIKRRDGIIIIPEMEKRIVGLYQEGMSSSKIASELKICQQSVIKILHRNNITLRHLKGQLKVNKELVEKRLNEKIKNNAIINHELPIQLEPPKPKQPLIIENKSLEDFFSKHQIYIKNLVEQINNLGMPEEYLEEYLIFIKQLAEKNRFIKLNYFALNSLLLNKVHIQHFLQKTEGRKMSLG